MKKLLVFMMAALMLVALAVTGCGGEEKKAAEAPEKVLRVATEPTFAPFEFQEEGSDKLSGFDMDLIRAIGACRHVRPVLYFRPYRYGSERQQRYQEH